MRAIKIDEVEQLEQKLSVLTTHTPVPAGHDRIHSDLIGKTTWKYRESLGLSHEQFMDLGRMHPGDRNEPFCMTTLALKTAGKSNAVSSIHGQVSRMMNILFV